MRISTRRASCDEPANCTDPEPTWRSVWRDTGRGQAVHDNLRTQFGQQNVGLLAAGRIGEADHAHVPGVVRFDPVSCLRDDVLRLIVDRRGHELKKMM